MVMLRHPSRYQRFSVTKFGEISPLWQNLTSHWQFIRVLLFIGIILKFNLANFACLWATLLWCKSTKIEEYSSNLVTLSTINEWENPHLRLGRKDVVVVEDGVDLFLALVLDVRVMSDQIGRKREGRRSCLVPATTAGTC